MSSPGWVERLERRAQRNVDTPWTGPAFLALSAGLVVAALLHEPARYAFLVMAAVWLVVGLTVLHVRRREVRRLTEPGGDGSRSHGTARPSH